MKTRVLMLTRYPRLGSSSRYRFFQYIPYLEQYGFEVTSIPLVDEEYLRQRYNGQSASKADVVRGYLHRSINLAKRANFDLIWIEKEAFPFLPSWIERLMVGRNVPYVVDYDDATFHNYDRHRRGIVRTLLGTKIDHVMRDSRLVVAGNSYLARRASDSGAENVTIVPTVVDLARYPFPGANDRDTDTVTFGWIGSPSTAKYLSILYNALSKVAETRRIAFTAIGSGELGWSCPTLTILPWTENTETKDLGTLDVGVMPLEDGPWERGKCGLKLIQYMALGLPVLASPVGVNVEIVEPGENGFLCSTEDEWIQAMELLASDPGMRKRFGEQGRRKVVEEFSLTSASPKVARALLEASGRSLIA